MIAGTGSGSGKTTIVCGLCQCFKDMGIWIFLKNTAEYAGLII